MNALHKGQTSRHNGQFINRPFYHKRFNKQRLYYEIFVAKIGFCSKIHNLVFDEYKQRDIRFKKRRRTPRRFRYGNRLYAQT